MAKMKDKSHPRKKTPLRSGGTVLKQSPRTPQVQTEDLLTQAIEFLEQSQPERALPLAEEALRRLETERQHSNSEAKASVQGLPDGQPTLPTTLVLYGEIHLALGDVDEARQNFLRATTLDPDGALVSAEPWLWLAQLADGGGRESIFYFEKALEVLRNEIEVLEDEADQTIDQNTEILDQRRQKLADALCAMAEVYMTDLSWEDDAEQRCDMFVTEAVAVCPERLSAATLQTLASVRISQTRVDDARQALRRSLQIWKDIPLEVEDEARPDFATRISLSRLLMEVELETDAMAVLEGLIREDDQCVECWYLGGWCQVLISQNSAQDAETQKTSQETAKSWLDACLRQCRLQEYEDRRLREHAVELVNELNNALGLEDVPNDDDDDDAWQDEGDEADDSEEEIEVGVNGCASDHDVDVEMS